MNEYQKRFIHKEKPLMSDKDHIKEQLDEIIKEHKLLYDIFEKGNRNKYSKV